MKRGVGVGVEIGVKKKTSNGGGGGGGGGQKEKGRSGRMIWLDTSLMFDVDLEDSPTPSHATCCSHFEFTKDNY